MTCGDNKQSSKSKVQRENNKQKQSKHGPLKKKVGQVAEGERASKYFITNDCLSIQCME